MITHGSREYTQFNLANNDENRQVLHRMAEELSNNGWRWYTDFYYRSDNHPIPVYIYNKELVPIIKEYIVERLI